jgi:hypothetical protein
VPFAKRKPGRNPLQRLSDQRRSLALVGLAAGAVLSAAFLRRRRRGGEGEFGSPIRPEPDLATEAAKATATQADQEAPETAAALNADVEPVGAASPAEDDASAGDQSPAEDEAPADEAAATTLSEPATGELSAEEASILAVLAQAGRADEDRTVIAVATSLERESADVADVLRKLSAEGVVAGDLYTATGDKIWTVTERGVRRLGAQH